MVYLVNVREMQILPRFESEPNWPSPKDIPMEQQTWWLAGHGKPVPPERFPVKSILRTRHKISDDVIHVGTSKWAISEPVRRIFEQFEPKQIEYFPIDIVRPGGKPVNDKKYCHINVLNSIQAIQWDQVTFPFEVSPKNGNRRTKINEGYFDGTNPPPPLHLNPAAYSGLHIWHEDNAGVMSKSLFMSDDVVDALRSAGVTGLLYREVQ
jgi:hypothetical protein